VSRGSIPRLGSISSLSSTRSPPHPALSLAVQARRRAPPPAAAVRRRGAPPLLLSARAAAGETRRRLGHAVRAPPAPLQPCLVTPPRATIFRFCQAGTSGFVRVAYPNCYLVYISSHISSHAFYFMHKLNIALMHASHSCIIVTESPENIPVEPTESVKPEPGVQFTIEPEANQGKQLSMNPCSYLT
jgi:hypothetical protein